MSSTPSTILSTDGRRDICLYPVPDVLASKLNAAQLLAVQSLDGPTLVVAGPGSGKTRVLTSRVASILYNNKARPWQILAVTFTNKAAAEMRERVMELIGEDEARSIWVGTFHSVCVRILRHNFELAGLPAGFTIADDRDQRVHLTRALLECGETADKSRVKDAARLIGLAKNNGQSPDDLIEVLDNSEIWVVPVMKAYNKSLQESGAVDFDDLLTRTLKLLKEHPDVLSSYQNKFKYILVDEYQDTNSVQYLIICLLSNSHNNIAVVGDADQSIYSWRGSAPDVVDVFLQDHPGSLVVRLEENYRSTKRIVETVSALIEPNEASNRAMLFTNNPLGEPVRMYVAPDDLNEASWVVSEIHHMGGDGHAILMRTNSQTRVFEEALVRSRTAYIVVGALRFYDRAEIKDALSYLRLAVNQNDLANFLRCANTPKRGFGEVSCNLVVNYARRNGVDLISACRLILESNTASARVVTSLKSFLTCFDLVSSAAALGPAAALDVVINQAVGLKASLVSQGETERVENLDELIVSAAEFSRIDISGIDGAVARDLPGLEQSVLFLENTALVASVDTDVDGINRERHPVKQVQIMTVHASKGREFANVWVVGVEDGLFPHTRSIGDRLAVEEERRLLFVAASRAQKNLTFSRCRRRMSYKKFTEPEASPFLANLPASVIRLDGGGFERGVLDTKPSKFASGKASATRRLLGSGPRVTFDQLAINNQVHHKLFGKGVVNLIESNTVRVLFDDGVERTLDLRLAPMSVL